MYYNNYLSIFILQIQLYFTPWNLLNDKIFKMTNSINNQRNFFQLIRPYLCQIKLKNKSKSWNPERGHVFIHPDKQQYVQYGLKLLSYTVSKNSPGVTSPELRKHCPLWFSLRAWEISAYRATLSLYPRLRDIQPAAHSQNMLNASASNSRWVR